MTKFLKNRHSHQLQLYYLFCANLQMLAYEHAKLTVNMVNIPASHQHFSFVIVSVLACTEVQQPPYE